MGVYVSVCACDSVCMVAAFTAAFDADNDDHHDYRHGITKFYPHISGGCVIGVCGIVTVVSFFHSVAANI